jgi:A/G-specific adenine glycosylase
MRKEEKERAFIKNVRAYAKKHGRTFPWRQTTDPYKILVSEIMLQQTQTDRVVPKYQSFLKQFPTVAVLAQASLGEVLRAWSGLGYNRRAKLLHACAQEVMATHGGEFPRTFEGLRALPGVGPYTAGAVLAFAFNQAHAVIETNIRTVYLHHFFPRSKNVRDEAILKRIEATLDRKNPRAWYAALMDYGVWIKKNHGNHNVRSRTYTKQKAFRGSARELRGKILRSVAEKDMGTSALARRLEEDPTRIVPQLEALVREGLLIQRRGRYSLPD